MVEEQVHVVVVAVERDALLAFDEGEARAQLEEKTLDLAQQGGLEVLLTVGVFEPEEIEHVGVLENEVGSQLVLRTQCFELLANELVGLLGEGGALVEHAADLLLERPRAPALDATHLGIEVAFEVVFQGDDVDEVRPPQLCHQ